MTESNSFELTPFEGTALPEGVQLTCFEDLVGHTIKAVVESPNGKWSMDGGVLLVTETNCWAAIEPGEECVKMHRRFGCSNTLLSDYLSPLDMKTAGLVTEAQYQFLREKEVASMREKDRKEAERLRTMAAELEGRTYG